MTKLAAILAVLALLAVPTGAAAHKHSVQHPTTDPVTLALELAEKYWGNAPCGGLITVVAATPQTSFATARQWESTEPLIGPTETLSMWVTFSTPDGPTDMSAPPATYTNCTIHANTELWGSWEADDFTFGQFCETIAHEIGHLEGHSDPGTPDTVTYIHPDNRGLLIAPCRNYLIWFNQHGQRWAFIPQPQEGFSYREPANELPSSYRAGEVDH